MNEPSDFLTPAEINELLAVYETIRNDVRPEYEKSLEALDYLLTAAGRISNFIEGYSEVPSDLSYIIRQMIANGAEITKTDVENYLLTTFKDQQIETAESITANVRSAAKIAMVASDKIQLNRTPAQTVSDAEAYLPKRPIWGIGDNTVNDSTFTTFTGTVVVSALQPYPIELSSEANRSASFKIQISDNENEVHEFMSLDLIHDDENVDLLQYGNMISGGNATNLAGDVVSSFVDISTTVDPLLGKLRLIFTPVRYPLSINFTGFVLPKE